MLRIAAAFTTAGLLTLGGGYLALGASGQDTPPAAAVAATATSSPMVAAASEERGLSAAAADDLAGALRGSGRG